MSQCDGYDDDYVVAGGDGDGVVDDDTYADYDDDYADYGDYFICCKYDAGDYDVDAATWHMYEIPMVVLVVMWMMVMVIIMTTIWVVVLAIWCYNYDCCWLWYFGDTGYAVDDYE